MTRAEDVLGELESMGVIGDVIGDIDLTPSYPEGDQPIEVTEAPELQTDEVNEAEETETSEPFDFSGLCEEAMEQLDQLIDCTKQLRKTFSILAEATGRRGDG